MSLSSGSIDLPKPRHRNIFFTKQVDQETIAPVLTAILDIEQHDEYLKKLYEIHNLVYTPAPIQIYIDSYGGSVYQCFGLLSVMEKSKTPIHTIVTGTAMSCGFMIAIHGHKRFCYENSTMMYHQVSSHAWGKLKDMEDDLKEAQRLQKRIMEMTVKKTKISLTKLEENLKVKEDWFMTAKEALDLGVVDEII